MQVVLQCEGGLTAFAIHWFSVNLFPTGAVTSQSSILQGRKSGMEGAKSVDTTVSDYF